MGCAMTNRMVTNRVANIANIPPIEGGNVRQKCSLNTREQCSLMFACSPKMFAFKRWLRKPNTGESVLGAIGRHLPSRGANGAGQRLRAAEPFPGKRAQIEGA
jgi:hypothetical protein